jgi:hypothetical protein
MDIVVLAIKAALALMLLVAGSAKLADVRGFAVSVQLFVPRHAPGFVLPGIALCAGLAELLLGAASFAFPALSWVNVGVLVAGCVFVLLSAAGYLFHRGIPCSCFGRLSPHVFDALTLARSLGIAALAAVVAVSTVSAQATRITVVAHVLLLATATVLSAAAATAARTLAALAEARPPVPAAVS